jgi:hypothetical protein
MRYRSWPCPHPRGSRLRPRPRLTVPSRTRPDALRTSSRGVARPSNAPSPGNPLPDTRLAKSRLPKKPNRLVPCLVAGFPKTRFGPPSPFPTTLTAYASPNPEVYFNLSRPWGWCSRLPVRGRNRDAQSRRRLAATPGLDPGVAPLRKAPGRNDARAAFHDLATAPPRPPPKRWVRLRLPCISSPDHR